jgi:HTH-type transcriptional regulator/antitoxin HigA
MTEVTMMNTNKMPAEVFPPGDFIREELEERGWTQEDLAEILGRSLRMVNEIIMGKRGITPDTANALGAAFGTSPQLWMNLESTYRLSLVRNRDTNTVERRAQLYSMGPINEMIKRQWLEPSQNITVLEERFKEFVCVDNLETAPTFYAHAARKSTPYHTETPAQTAWLFRARQLAGAISASRYSANQYDALIEDLRELASSPEESRHVASLLADAGIRLVVIEPLKGSRIDGVCFWPSKEEPVVAISMRYNRIDYFWHTLMHELAHVKNQDGLANMNAAIDVDAGDSTLEKPSHEEEADIIAAEALVPRNQLQDFIDRVGPIYSPRAIRGFAATIGVHSGIVVGQLQHRNEIAYSQFRQYLVPVRNFVTGAALTDGWGHYTPLN